MRCPSCGKETRVGNRTCVECGASLVQPGAGRRWKIFSAVAAGVVVASVALWATCSMCSEGSEETGTTQGELEIVSHELRRKTEFWGGLEVTGIAKNVGSERLSYAEIDCLFYDIVGNEVDASLAWTSDLDPGETWAFKFETFDWRADNYDISVGDYW